jgi:hypothetical protein
MDDLDRTVRLDHESAHLPRRPGERVRERSLHWQHL